MEEIVDDMKRFSESRLTLSPNSVVSSPVGTPASFTVSPPVVEEHSSRSAEADHKWRDVRRKLRALRPSRSAYITVLRRHASDMYRLERHRTEGGRTLSYLPSQKKLFFVKKRHFLVWKRYVSILRLLRSSFRKWRQFVGKQKQHHVKLRKLENLLEERRTRRRLLILWYSWIRYVQIRRASDEIMRRNNRRLVEGAWMTLRDTHKERVALDGATLRMNFSAWLTSFRERKKESRRVPQIVSYVRRKWVFRRWMELPGRLRNMALADSWSCTNILKKHLREWSQYVRQIILLQVEGRYKRKARFLARWHEAFVDHEKRKLATNCFARKVFVSVLSEWKLLISRRKKENAIFAAIYLLKLKSSFKRWRRSCFHRVAWHMSIEFYRVRVLVCGNFERWKRAYESRRITCWAQNAVKGGILSRSMFKWQELVYKRLNEESLVAQVWCSHDESLLRSTFNTMRELMYDKFKWRFAARAYSQRSLEKSLFRWRIYIVKMRRIRRASRIARKNTAFSVKCRYLRKMVFSLTYCINMRVADSFFGSNVKKRLFERWILAFRSSRKMRMLLGAASKFASVRLLSKHLRAWKNEFMEFCENSDLERGKWIRFREQRVLLFPCLKRWQYRLECRVENRGFAITIINEVCDNVSSDAEERHENMRLLRKYFVRLWDARRYRWTFERIVCERRQSLQSKMFYSWLTMWKKCAAAVSFRMTGLLTRTFDQLKKSIERRHALISFAHELDVIRRRHLFQYFLSLWWNMAQIRRKWNRGILRQTLWGWLGTSLNLRTKRSQERKAMICMYGRSKELLVSSAFRVWKSLYTGYKKGQGLRSRRILRRLKELYMKWRRFHAFKIRKKQRYAATRELFQRLLGELEGVVSGISKATEFFRRHTLYKCLIGLHSYVQRRKIMIAGQGRRRFMWRYFRHWRTVIVQESLRRQKLSKSMYEKDTHSVTPQKLLSLDRDYREAVQMSAKRHKGTLPYSVGRTKEVLPQRFRARCMMPHKGLLWNLQERISHMDAQEVTPPASEANRSISSTRVSRRTSKEKERKMAERNNAYVVKSKDEKRSRSVGRREPKPNVISKQFQSGNPTGSPYSPKWYPAVEKQALAEAEALRTDHKETYNEYDFEAKWKKYEDDARRKLNTGI